MTTQETAPTASKPLIIVQFDQTGDINYFVGDDAILLIIDERAPDDRVYLYGGNSTKAEMRELIGEGPIGHSGDGYLSPNKIDAIKAALWLNNGAELRIVEKERT